MKTGVGLPATIPRAPADVVLEWAKRADKLGFSSLGIIDRIVYKNYESMATLAAAAGVTRKVRLMTSVVVAPARESVLLAKQAATVDRISNGRPTLGMGVGARKDDFDATHTSFKTRGRRFDEQLRLMKSVWSGQSVSETAGAVGPQVVQKGGPEVLIGGYGAGVAPRVAKWGDGYVSGGVPAEAAAAVFRSVKDAWGRPDGQESRAWSAQPISRWATRQRRGAQSTCVTTTVILGAGPTTSSTRYSGAPTK